MKKLLGIIVLGLLLSGNVLAKETNILCEFQAGYWSDINSEDPNNLDWKNGDILKGESGTENALLILDFDKEIIIQADGFYIHGEDKECCFDDDYVYGSDSNNNDTITNKFKLNRISGQLETSYTVRLSKKHGTSRKKSYTCKKINKKF